MRVLIGCEKSGVVRRAFAARGHEAWSCDLQAADDLSPFHVQGDVLALLREPWDLFICHPPCTFLTNSAAWAFGDGPYHQEVKAGTLTGAARRAARAEAVEFALALWNCAVGRVVLENPVGHLSRVLGRPAQIIQPYSFGSDASKGTCLWMRGRGVLPLTPTHYVEPRLVCSDCSKVFAYGQHKCPSCGSHEFRPRWANQTDSGQNRLSPSADRAGIRSETYPGIAEAMAQTWGSLK